MSVSQIRNEKRTAILVTLMTRKKKERLYGVYRPNTGLQPRYEALDELKKKYRKVRYSFCFWRRVFREMKLGCHEKTVRWYGVVYLFFMDSTM